MDVNNAVVFGVFTPESLHFIFMLLLVFSIRASLCGETAKSGSVGVAAVAADLCASQPSYRSLATGRVQHVAVPAGVSLTCTLPRHGASWK